MKARRVILKHKMTVKPYLRQKLGEMMDKIKNKIYNELEPGETVLTEL